MSSESYFKQQSLNEAKKRNIDVSKLPKHLSMTPETITANVLEITSLDYKDERTNFVLRSLVHHLHAFVRETSLTTDEWTWGLEFLTAVGKMSADVRPEFILLSDALGVSALVDSINNNKPPGTTEGTVLGPFFSEHTVDIENGESISSEGKGDYMFVEGRVLNLEGKPIADAIIDTWESDADGVYDLMRGPDQPECRGRVKANEDGSFKFRATVPVPYSVPDQGPVTDLYLNKTGRHPIRPAHLHFKIQAPDYETLVTALYFKGDAFVTSDAVFGVKSSLIVEPEIITDVSVTKARGFKEERPHIYLKQDFILASPQEAKAHRQRVNANNEVRV